MNALKAAMDHTFVQENKATTEATDKRVQAITETFETFVDRLRNLVDAASEEQYQSRLQEVRDTYKELHSEDKRAIRDQIYTLCSSPTSSLIYTKFSDLSASQLKGLKCVWSGKPSSLQVFRDPPKTAPKPKTTSKRDSDASNGSFMLSKNVPDEPEVDNAPPLKKAKIGVTRDRSTRTASRTDTSGPQTGSPTAVSIDDLNNPQPDDPPHDPMKTIRTGQELIKEGLDILEEHYQRRIEDVKANDSEEKKKANTQLEQALEDIVEKDKKIENLEGASASKDAEQRKLQAENQQLKNKNEELESKWAKMRLVFDEQK